MLAPQLPTGARFPIPNSILVHLMLRQFPTANDGARSTGASRNRQKRSPLEHRLAQSPLRFEAISRTSRLVSRSVSQPSLSLTRCKAYAANRRKLGRLAICSRIKPAIRQQNEEAAQRPGTAGHPNRLALGVRDVPEADAFRTNMREQPACGPVQ